MRSLALLLASSALLAGCGVAARYDARTDYQNSTAAYKACLAANPPQACENQRLIMEADARKYDSVAGGHASGTLTIQNR